MMLLPVRIRLSKHEAVHLTTYIYRKCDGILKNPDVRNDLIVLAEYYEKLYRKCRTHQLKTTNKPVLYLLPMSIARILHHRFQKETIHPTLQNVLNNLDQELTNLSMKPTFPITLL